MKRNFSSGKYTIEEKFTLNVLRPSFKGIPVVTPEKKPNQPGNMNLLEQTKQQEKLIQKTDAESTGIEYEKQNRKLMQN
jgi:hypothetical protein